MNASKLNQAGAAGNIRKKFQTLSKQMHRQTGHLTRQTSFVDKEPYLHHARSQVYDTLHAGSLRYQPINNQQRHVKNQMRVKAVTMPTTSREVCQSAGVTHFKNHYGSQRWAARNRDFQSVTPDEISLRVGSDAAQWRSAQGSVYKNVKNEAAMSNKISSWLDNYSGHSDNSDQDRAAELGRDLPGNFFRSNVYSSKASLYEGGKTSSTRTKKAARRTITGSPGVPSPPRQDPNTSTIEQARGSRGGGTRRTGKGRHRKGKSSQKSSIGGSSVPIAPEQKLSSDARVEESKDANRATLGELGTLNTDQVNNVNYESEGEQLAEGQQKQMPAGGSKKASQKNTTRIAREKQRAADNNGDKYIKLLDLSPPQHGMTIQTGVSDLMKPVDSFNVQEATPQFVASVVSGVDMFTRYEPSKMSMIFHGRQAANPSKTELLQAKRESRALRKAKLTQQRHKFIDAYCEKVLERVQQLMVNELVDGSLNRIMAEVEKRAAHQKKLSSASQPMSHGVVHSGMTSIENQPNFISQMKTNTNQKLTEGADNLTMTFDQDPKQSPIKEDFHPDATSFSHASVLQPGAMAAGERNIAGPVNVSHEIASANELNMFVPKEVIGNYYDVSCSLDNDLTNSQLRPMAGGNQILISNEKEPAEFATDQIRFYASASKHDPMRVASIAAAQAAAANQNNLVDLNQVNNYKSYMPYRTRKTRENVNAAVNAAYYDYGANVLGMSTTPPRNINSSSEAYRARKADPVNYESARSPLQVPNVTRQTRTAGGGKRRRQQYQNMPVYRRDPNIEYMYSNADLSRIQEQIRFQVEQQRRNAAAEQKLMERSKSPESVDKTLSNHSSRIDRQQPSVRIVAHNKININNSTQQLDGTSPYQSALQNTHHLIEEIDMVRPGSRQRIEGGASRNMVKKKSSSMSKKAERDLNKSQVKQKVSQLVDGKQVPQVKRSKLGQQKSSSQEMESLDFMGKSNMPGARTDQTNSRDDLKRHKNVAIQGNKNNGRAEYSESKQMFAMQGPILKQQNLEQHKRDMFTNYQNKINKKNKLSQERIMPLNLTNQKLQKQASAKKMLECHQGSNLNQEFISSFDVNEKLSDTYQNSILAISQFNAGLYLEDSSPDLHKSKNGGSIVARVVNQSSDKKNGRRQAERRHASQGQKRAVNIVSNDRLKKVVIHNETAGGGLVHKGVKSTNSITSSKYSGVSSFKPIKDQQNPRLMSQGKSADGDHMTGYDPKARIKRAWTLKQETQPVGVIEEGSDDNENSFASDTPAAAPHRKRRTGTTIVVEDFDQATRSGAQPGQPDAGSPTTSKVFQSVKQEMSADQAGVAISIAEGSTTQIVPAAAKKKQAPITSATKLRQRVINLRKSANNNQGNKNVWMGGSASSASQSSGKNELVHFKGTGPAQQQRGARMVVSHQQNRGGGNIANQQWVGRASHHFQSKQTHNPLLLGQNVGMAQVYMNRHNNTKLQKIARPYLMSAGSGGHTLSVGIKNQIGASASSYGLKNLVLTNSKFSIATHPEPENYLRKGLPEVAGSQSAINMQNQSEKTTMMYATGSPKASYNKQLAPEYDGAALSAQQEAMSHTNYSNNDGAASSFATATLAGHTFTNRITAIGSQAKLRDDSADFEATQLRRPGVKDSNCKLAKSFATVHSNQNVATDSKDPHQMAVSFGIDQAQMPVRKKTGRGIMQQRIGLFGQQLQFSSTHAPPMRPKSNKIITRKPAVYNPISASQQRQMLLERQRHNMMSEPSSLASTEILANRVPLQHQRRYLRQGLAQKAPSAGGYHQQNQPASMHQTKTLSDMLQRQQVSPRDGDLPPLGRDESEAMILAVNQEPANE